MDAFLQHILPSSADMLARHTVAALSNGDAMRAVAFSQHLSVQFPYVQEGRLLHAVALSRLKEHLSKKNHSEETLSEDVLSEDALRAWDRALRHDPLQPEHVAQALRLAWKTNNIKYATRWISLLEHTFLMPPPIALLGELEAQGWKGIGSLGIHDGKLHGWTWQPLQDADGLPRFTVSPGTAKAPELHVGPIQRLKTADHVLNIFSFPLPKANGSYTLRVEDAQGRQALGSPAVCSWVAPKKSVAYPKQSPVAILIPVYADRRATLACIGSVFASRKANRTPFELVIVWDHGPDVRLDTDLQRLAANGKLTLHTPPHNMGFLAAVNFALEQHPKQSVVLLNADAIVSGDWLDRLHRHGSQSGIGTVTPFGTHAELMSFPAPKVKKSLCRLRDVRLLDAACKRTVAKETTDDLPVGVGFCMYIPRAVLDRIGGLDGHALFRGYGEEVEFCLRAHKNGFRNIAACDVFVGHVGERSFGAGKLALAAQNNQFLFAHYPKYQKEYDLFVALDSLEQLRERVSRVAVSPFHVPLHIFTASDFISLDAFFEAEANVALLVLQPCGDRLRAMLRVRQGLPLPDMNFLLPGELPDLLQTLERLAPSEGVLHSSCLREKAFVNQLSFPYRMASNPNPETLLELTLDAVSAGKCWIVPAPRTIPEWQKLCRIARVTLRDGHVFRVPYLEKIWGNCPRPVNIWPALSLEDLAVCAEGLLFLNPSDCNTLWLRWADREHLAAYRLRESSEMREAACA